MVLKRQDAERIPDAPRIRGGQTTPTMGSSRDRIGTQTVAPGNVLQGRTAIPQSGPGQRPLFGDRRDNPPNPFDIAGDFSPGSLPALVREMQRLNELHKSRQGGLPVAVARPTPPPPVISPSVSRAGQTEGVKIEIPAKTTKETTMDLGDILGKAVGYYKDYQVAKSVPQYVEGRYGGGSVPIQATPALNVPFVDVIPEAENTKGMVWNPRANCGNGGWVKARRRRRRRLATTSDIKDLAALKAVLGGGKAFETWIATH